MSDDTPAAAETAKAQEAAPAPVPPAKPSRLKRFRLERIVERARGA